MSGLLPCVAAVARHAALSPCIPHVGSLPLAERAERADGNHQTIWNPFVALNVAGGQNVAAALR
jgi:hypothetical protein